MPVPNNSYSDERWVGIDAYHAPGKMGATYLAQADNCLIEGGDIVSRPGRVGLLNTPHTAPTYLLGPFRRADGTTAITYTSGGRLYRLDKGAAVPIEILSAAGQSLALNSQGAFAARLGRYQYVVDGSGPLIRTDLSTGAASPFLNAPSAAPTVSLTSTLIDPLTGGPWATDALTGPGQANRLPNASFASPASGTSQVPTGWNTTAGNPDLYGTGHTYLGPDAHGQSGAWLLMDHVGEGVVTTAALANDSVSSDALRYATQFYAALTLFQSDTTGLSSLFFGLLVYSDAAGNNLITEVDHEFTVPFSGNKAAVTLDTVFSFASLPLPVLSYRVRLYGGGQNGKSGGDIYCQYPVCFPFSAALTTPVSGTQIEIRQPQQIAYTGGTQAQSLPGTVGLGVGAGGVHLTRDFGAGSPQDWSKYSEVALALGKAAGVAGLSLSLAFRQDDGSGTRYYTNTFAISADGTVATCDISTVLKSVRASFRWVELVLGGDFTVPAANGTDLFLFGPLTGAGNLSIGYADYSYPFTEINASTDAAYLVDVLESSPSPVSGSLTPTLTQAEAAVTLPAAGNASAGYFAVYRYGGVFDDNPAVARLIAVVPVGADIAPGADARNPYYGWNYLTRTLTDNTPDSYILQPGVFPVTGTPMVSDRAAPPSGAQAVCAYHGRLILAVGSVLWISWLVTPTNPSALYFTTVQIPGDPNEAVKGAQFPIGGQFDNDPIQALVPHNTDVVIEKHTAKSLLQGYSGENFAVTDYLQGAGFGCIAPRTALLMGNYESCLCASGPFRFDGAAADEFGLYVESLIRPRGYDGLPVVSAAALSGAAAVYHDRRYLLSVPDPGQAANTRTYVYDTRLAAEQFSYTPYHGGWTRFNFGFTSAVTTSSGTDSDNLYLGGVDGQVYTLSGSADVSGPAATPQPIPCTVVSRGYGMDAGEFWREDDAQRLFTQIGAPAGTVLSRSVSTDYPGRFRPLPDYTLSDPYAQVETKITALTGHYLTATHIWSSPGPVRLYGFRLTASPRGPETE